MHRVARSEQSGTRFSASSQVRRKLIRFFVIVPIDEIAVRSAPGAPLNSQGFSTLVNQKQLILYSLVSG